MRTHLLGIRLRWLVFYPEVTSGTFYGRKGLPVRSPEVFKQKCNQRKNPVGVDQKSAKHANKDSLPLT